MVRNALVTDAEAITDLSGQLGYFASVSETRHRLEAIAARGDGWVFVAERDGRVVGWVHVHGVHVVESPPHAEIGGLVVDEHHRGAGIGRELMAAAERWAEAAGYPTVRLRSNVVREAAHAFYRRLGYREIKRQAAFSKPL